MKTTTMTMTALLGLLLLAGTVPTVSAVPPPPPTGGGDCQGIPDYYLCIVDQHAGVANRLADCILNRWPNCP